MEGGARERAGEGGDFQERVQLSGRDGRQVR